MNLLTVSMSPHNYGDQSVKKLMYGVIIALLPAFLVSLYFFGIGALVVTLTSVVSAMVFEYVISKYVLKSAPSLTDGSALLTGLLLAFNLPSNLPILIVVIGAFVAIAIGKINPALVGRVFLLVSFPVQMTSWPLPVASRMSYLDAVTGATPLGIVKEGLKNGEPMAELMHQIPSHAELFYGAMGGSLGEVAGAALLLGLIYMLIRKIITWHIPVSIIVTLSLLTGIAWLINPQANADPLFHVLTGGVLLGAIFMATDYVTSPMNVRGMIIFGFGIGLLTFLIRDERFCAAHKPIRET